MGVHLPGAGREETRNKCGMPLLPGSDVGTLESSGAHCHVLNCWGGGVLSGFN